MADQEQTGAGRCPDSDCDGSAHHWTGDPAPVGSDLCSYCGMNPSHERELCRYCIDHIPDWVHPPVDPTKCELCSEPPVYKDGLCSICWERKEHLFARWSDLPGYSSTTPAKRNTV